jgi:hypothetical protein
VFYDFDKHGIVTLPISEFVAWTDSKLEEVPNENQTNIRD